MKCEHDGCKERGEFYYIDGYIPVPEFLFCPDHAAKFGFCLTCGAFIGGTEDVFLTGRTGQCFDCFQAERREYKRDFDDQFGEDEYEDFS